MMFEGKIEALANSGGKRLTCSCAALNELTVYPVGEIHRCYKCGAETEA